MTQTCRECGAALGELHEKSCKFWPGRWVREMHTGILIKERLIKPATERDLPKEPKETPLAKAHRVKAENAVKKKRSLRQRVKAAIDNPRCDQELRRKLQYCLDNPDHPGVNTTLGLYLSEAERLGLVEARA